MNLKPILTSIATAAIIAVLSGIWYNTRDVPQFKERFEDIKVQNDRYDELIQQEIEKRIELEKEILILKTKLHEN
jgi:hypothetical protein